MDQRHGEPAVSSGSAVANGVCLQKSDAETRISLEQSMGGPESGKAGARNRDIDFQITS